MLHSVARWGWSAGTASANVRILANPATEVLNGVTGSPNPPRHRLSGPVLDQYTAEVEALVKEKHGAKYLARQKLQTELKSVNRQIRSLKTKIKGLEKRKAELLDELEGG